MINLHSPFKPWESNYGKHFIFGFVGDAALAATQFIANRESWEYAKDIPKEQAKANIKVLQLERDAQNAFINGGTYTLEDGGQSKNIPGIRPLLQDAISDYMDFMDKLIDGDLADNFNEAFPDVPEAAEYVPVDVCCIQGSAVECNISHTARTDTWVRNVNRLHEQNDLIHLLSLCPDFLVNLDILNKSVQDLMRGILPVGDVVEVLTDNAEQAALSGRIGSTRKTTARDLGISKLRLQAAGRREMREHGAWLNTSVSPQQRQLSIKDMMLSPQDRVNWALAQAQLIQNSLQNKNNRLAQKEPYKMARIQLRMQKQITRLQQRATRALISNTSIPNYALTMPGPGPDPGMKTAGLANLVGSIGSKIEPALKSWFFGGTPTSQDGGYTGTDDTSSKG